jgi:hypothetical protein
MKKLSFVLILLLVSIAFGFTAVNENRSLNVYGKINEGLISFGVAENTTSAAPVDLLGDAMNPYGTSTYAVGAAPGIKVGSWTFSGVNQTETSYQITYTFSSLSGPGGTIAFQLSEDSTTWLSTGGTTGFTAAAGNPSEGSDIFARLTTAGRDAAVTYGAGNYTTTVSVNLVSL